MDASGDSPSSRSSNGPRTEVACKNCRSVKKKCEQDRDPNIPCRRCDTKGIRCIRSIPSLRPSNTNATDPNIPCYPLIQALDPPEDPYRNSQAFQQGASLSGPVNGQVPVRMIRTTAIDSSPPSNSTPYYGSQIYPNFSFTDPTRETGGIQAPRSAMQIAPGQQMSTARYEELPGVSTSSGAFHPGREIPDMSSLAPVNGDGHSFSGSLADGQRADMSLGTEEYTSYPSVWSSDREGGGSYYHHGNIGTS